MTKEKQCDHQWKNVSSKRQTVYQCERCGVYSFENPAQPVQQQEPAAMYVGETWCGSVVSLYEDLPLKTLLYTSSQAVQKQEPYGWKVLGVSSLFMGEFAEYEAKSEARRIGGTSVAFPIYTSPSASKPWVSLTDAERRELRKRHQQHDAFAKAIDAALKEKNYG